VVAMSTLGAISSARPLPFSPFEDQRESLSLSQVSAGPGPCNSKSYECLGLHDIKVAHCLQSTNKWIRGHVVAATCGGCLVHFGTLDFY